MSWVVWRKWEKKAHQLGRCRAVRVQSCFSVCFREREWIQIMATMSPFFIFLSLEHISLGLCCVVMYWFFYVLKHLKDGGHAVSLFLNFIIWTNLSLISLICHTNCHHLHLSNYPFFYYKLFKYYYYYLLLFVSISKWWCNIFLLYLKGIDLNSDNRRVNCNYSFIYRVHLRLLNFIINDLNFRIFCNVYPTF